MWGNNKTCDRKKGGFTLGPVGLKKGEKTNYTNLPFVRQTYDELENSKIIPQNRETTQNHRPLLCCHTNGSINI